MTTLAPKKEPDIWPSTLAQFTGTGVWYRHALVKRITYTEGVKYVADQAGAYWLLDEIVVAQFGNQDVLNEPFQIWKLKVDQAAHSAVLTVEDGNYKELFRKKFEFTDFPADEITFWFTDDVILLPSEY
jgi:hypothetical protein